jgi:uncharacterized glyoxalase superfamily protein PhnB
LDRLFAARSEGGTGEMALAEIFGDDGFDTWVDTFGIQWMISCTNTLERNEEAHRESSVRLLNDS